MKKNIGFKIVTFTLLIYLCACSNSSSEDRNNYNCTNIKSDSVYVYIHKSDTIVNVVRNTVRDTIYSREKDTTIVIHGIIPDLDLLDSLQTAKEMSNVLAYGFILYQPKLSDIMPSIAGLDDLSLLPYLLDMYSNKQVLPHGNYEYMQFFIEFCTRRINDPKLFALGKRIVEHVDKITNHHYGRAFSNYLDSFNQDSYYINRREMIDGAFVSVDSLRVMALVHNDREALNKLEKYYRGKGDDKGLAIYYKLMLGYEGNGDLAERFYRVLEPYFGESPELRAPVREILLRAAICDKNPRAQQLCDSLGFSLCDYRLPAPDEAADKP